MTQIEYEKIQKFCRKKLKNKNNNIRFLSNKYTEGYEDGIKAIMSFLHGEKEYNNLID